MPSACSAMMSRCSRRCATPANAPASAVGRYRCGTTTGSCSSPTWPTSRIRAGAPPARSPAPGSCVSSSTASRGYISTSPERRTWKGKAPVTPRGRRRLASGCSRSSCSNAPALDSGGVIALAFLPSALAAQADTTARDTTTRRDTTAAQDTTPALLPTFAPAIMPGPLPKGTRYTFTLDSVLLSSARTLSDLLSHIPGVYVARGGWYGEPEIVLYGGRGPASLELYWDGMPMLPLGRDSVYLDPARIPLAPIERVDVIMLPASLQVYLVTSQHRPTAPRTLVGIVSGQQDIADYRAGYATRTRSGFGVSLLADWASIGTGSPGNTTPPFGTSDIWVKADYVPPGGRVGASFQVSSSSWHRATASDGRVDGWRQDRRDKLLRLFVAERDDGLGWRLTATLGTSGVSHDTLVARRTVTG